MKPVATVGRVAVLVGIVAVSCSAVSAWAAGSIVSAQIRDNTIRSRDLRNGDVRSADIANGSIKSIDVNNNTLLSDDISDSAVGTSEVADGAVGANDLAAIPHAEVQISADQSIPSAAVTALSWDTEVEDGWGMHDGVNPTRLTAPTAGLYLVQGNGRWQGAAAGATTLEAILNVNDGGSIDTQVVAPSAATNYRADVMGIYRFDAGEYVEMVVRQDDIAARDITSSDSTFLKMTRIGS